MFLSLIPVPMFLFPFVPFVLDLFMYPCVSVALVCMKYYVSIYLYYKGGVRKITVF